MLGAVLVAAMAVWAWSALRVPAADPAMVETEIEVVDGLAVTYLATPALLDEMGLRPRRDFGVAANGNVVISTEEGVYELEVRDQEIAFTALQESPLDTLALDAGAVVLGIRERFFGQVGPDGFDKALPLPEGEVRLATSTRPGWVYLFRNEPSGDSRLYGIWDNGAMATLVEFDSPIRAVADDQEHTYLATDKGLFAVDDQDVRLISGVTPDLGPAHALAAGPGRLFVAANRRVYVLVDGTLLAIVRGTTPEMALLGDRLYCWDRERRLLYSVDVGPLFANGETT